VLGLIPLFLLLGGAVSVTVLRFVPRGTGFAWLISILTSLGALIVFILSKNSLPFMYGTEILSDISINIKLPAFQIDLIIWPLVMSILAVINGTLITSASRIGLDADCREWTGVLLIGVIGICACVSQNVITGLVFISLFDLSDMILTLSSQNQNKLNYRFHFWRLASLILIFTAFAWNGLDPKNSYDWETLKPEPAQIALIACMVRFSLTPVISLAGKPRKSSNGVETARTLVGFIITSSIVFQLPVFSGNTTGKIIILLYLLLSLIFALSTLLENKKENYPIAWQIIGGALICAEYIYGYSASAIILLTGIIPIIFIFLQRIRKGRVYLVAGAIALIGFSGLPFTPNSTGLNGFGMKGEIPGLFFLLCLIPIFDRMIRIVVSDSEESNPDLERWASALSPIGIFIVIISNWLIFFLWQPGNGRLNFSIQAVIMTLGGIGIFIGEKFHLFDSGKIGEGINIFFSRYRLDLHLPNRVLTANVVAIIERPFLFITGLFEGDGGILWAILCLVLVITIISGFGMP
jgi:hypothetical protein